ncbi:hypothetical protein L1887_18782 [Cichorium endivia]|nr:hypothetical protein L1887_18782 [Cichorium endivia]
MELQLSRRLSPPHSWVVTFCSSSFLLRLEGFIKVLQQWLLEVTLFQEDRCDIVNYDALHLDPKRIHCAGLQFDAYLSSMKRRDRELNSDLVRRRLKKGNVKFKSGSRSSS